MSHSVTQISANISRETKDRMEAFVRERGLKKGHLIEAALQHYLNAMDALPPDVVIPPMLWVSRETGERLLELIDSPPEPTPAMKALFDG